MSQETVKLARELMKALSHGDLPRLIDFADPEVEWHSFFAELGGGGVYAATKGRGGT
jgi:hypothetical protein